MEDENYDKIKKGKYLIWQKCEQITVIIGIYFLFVLLKSIWETNF